MEPQPIINCSVEQNFDQLSEAGEGERRRMEEYLHDHLCQALASASMAVEVLGRDKAGLANSMKTLGMLRRAVDRLIDEVRGMGVAIGLRSNPGGAELMKALAGLAAVTPNASFVCESPLFVRRPETALAIFRIAQEAAVNASRHAKASSICVTLGGTGEKPSLEVRDDGLGFVPSQGYAVSSGIGFMQIRARAAHLRLRIDTAPGRGTAVCLGSADEA